MCGKIRNLVRNLNLVRRTNFGNVGQLVDNELLPFPDDERLPYDTTGIPCAYHGLGDSAFTRTHRLVTGFLPCDSRCMLTAEEHQTNYRIARCRRTVENAFGSVCDT